MARFEIQVGAKLTRTQEEKLQHELAARFKEQRERKKLGRRGQIPQIRAGTVRVGCLYLQQTLDCLGESSVSVANVTRFDKAGNFTRVVYQRGENGENPVVQRGYSLAHDLLLVRRAGVDGQQPITEIIYEEKEMEEASLQRASTQSIVEECILAKMIQEEEERLAREQKARVVYHDNLKLVGSPRNAVLHLVLDHIATGISCLAEEEMHLQPWHLVAFTHRGVKVRDPGDGVERIEQGLQPSLSPLHSVSPSLSETAWAYIHAWEKERRVVEVSERLDDLILEASYDAETLNRFGALIKQQEEREKRTGIIFQQNG